MVQGILWLGCKIVLNGVDILKTYAGCCVEPRLLKYIVLKKLQKLYVNYYFDLTNYYKHKCKYADANAKSNIIYR